MVLFRFNQTRRTRISLFIMKNLTTIALAFLACGSAMAAPAALIERAPCNSIGCIDEPRQVYENAKREPCNSIGCIDNPHPVAERTKREPCNSIGCINYPPPALAEVSHTEEK